MQWGLSAVSDVKSVVLIVRVVILLAALSYNIVVTGLFARSSHHVSAPRPPCTRNQNFASVTLVPSGSKVSLDHIPRGNLCRPSE